MESEIQRLIPLVLAASLACAEATSPPHVVRDVTQLVNIRVDAEVRPTNTAEVQQILRDHVGPVSIGGGRFSMGGQVASEHTLHIDMRQMDQVVDYDPAQKTVTVQAGITWRQLQEHIDDDDLSIMIMQSYANFTVGGTVSVNAHGRYVNQGPVVHSVQALELVMADGTVVQASRDEHADLFFGAIGGYGALAVITQVTLDLDDNLPLERTDETMPVADYRAWFKENIEGSDQAVFHNADLYPPNYTEAVAITYSKTDRAVTVPDRLQPGGTSSAFEKAMYWAVTELPYGKQLRSEVIDPMRLGDKPVVWRNYEASYDVRSLDPGSRKHTTYVLLEYFVPVDRFEEFIPLMAEVYTHYDANIANVSIRHCGADPDTLMTWAPVESYAFVVYYKQGTEPHERTKVGIWTRALNDAVLAVDGTMYLPYQPHATEAQFHQAYPRANELFALKFKVDPDYRFRNTLWDTYLPPPVSPLQRAEQDVRAKLALRTDYLRPEDQTFLTLPEWSIVYAADELGASLQQAPPSSFPFFASLAQFWEVYTATAPQTNRYDYNSGYHGMIWTIGVSYTVEYAIRGAYEGTVGALTEWWHGGSVNSLAEDQFAAQYATDYGNFIHATPWYAYPYTTKAADLRALPGTWSVRGLERRFSLYVELYAKAAWGGAMGWASNATYGAETGTIHAWIHRGDTDPDSLSGVTVVEDLGNDWLLVALDRYEPFTTSVPALVDSGASFVEIAGNHTILITLIAPDTWTGVDRVGQLVYEWPILTLPGQKRVAVEVPVSALHLAMPAITAEGVTLHHIYDY